ncbi:MAG: DUF6091 family protein [Oleibacter sp.]|nr:DUF6091 family protein [Thalassolituus sp.]
MLRAVILFLSFVSHMSWANANPTLCVFDPVGSNGPIYAQMQEYRTQALNWGVSFNIKAYTSESVAVGDFKAGICEAVLITGTQARQFNRFTGTVEAVGGLNSYNELQELITLLASPNAARYQKEGRYEIAGIIPGGSVFVFVRDKAIDSIEAASGKKVATLDYDMASRKVVDYIGATIVPSTVATFAPRFNNGDVDIAYAPAIAYAPFEMYRGLGSTGGIYRFAFAQMNFQIVLQQQNFADDFAQKSREYIAQQFNKSMNYITLAESEIPSGYWLDLEDQQAIDYLAMLARIRTELADEGVYDPQMIKLMKNLRCRANPMHAECSFDLDL